MLPSSFFFGTRAAIQTVLSDNGREFCGRAGSHPYELFLQLEGIEHRTTKVRRLQSNGFIERLHRTLLDEHFRIASRTKWYETIEEMFLKGMPKLKNRWRSRWPKPLSAVARRKRV